MAYAKLSLTAALIFLAAAVFAEDGEDLTSVHSCWCAWYQTKWGGVPHDSLEPLAPEKLDALSDRYIAQCREKVAQRKFARSGEAWIDLGEALIFRKRWHDAREAYTTAAKFLPTNTAWMVRIHYRLAESWFGENDREAAIAELRRAVAVKGVNYGRGATCWTELAQDALNYLTDQDLDYYGMPRDTGFKPFPEPQQAEYTEEFAPCPEISLRPAGVEKTDARIRLLTKKLSRRGFKWNFAGPGYPLTIALDENAPIEKYEGYVLETTAKGASIRARDPRGVLWGIVSFLQIADPRLHTVRICRVNDWPDCKRRGYLGTFWSGCAEFTIFNKLSMVVHQRHPLTDGADSPLNVYQCERLGNEFRELGLELEYGMVTWTMNMGWPYCWKSYLGMQVEIGRKFAAMGAGVYYPNDDCRYDEGVLREEDLADGKRPSDFDADHILEFYNLVKAEYPDFRMTYCPPYYWGPRRNPYPDDPEKYLKSLRRLPREIAIIWTGPAVKSFQKTPQQVAYVTSLTQHKPMLFQNATGPHLLLSYAVDRTDWNAWHYPGFFEQDIEGYLKNSTTPTECPQLTTLADCLWNVKGYDQERSIRRGMSNYAGAKFFDLLDGVYRDLCHLDRYRYGEVSPTVLDEDAAELERKYLRIEAATKAAAELNGWEFMNRCASWTRAVGWFKGIVAAARNPPDFRQLYGDRLTRVRDLAYVAGYDPKNGDVLLDAIDLRHGETIQIPPPPHRGDPPPKSPMMYCGVWDNQTVDAKFRLRREDSQADGRLIVKAVNDLYWNGDHPENRFSVRLNGKTLYDGKHPFRDQDRFELKVTAADLHLNGENTIEFHNGRAERQLRILFAALVFPKPALDPNAVMNDTGEEGLSLDE